MSDSPSSEVKVVPIDPSMLMDSEKLVLIIHMLRDQYSEMRDMQDTVKKIKTRIDLVYNEVSSHGKRLGELGDTFNKHCDIMQKMLGGDGDGNTKDSV